jgi:hypothetical protein
LVSPLDLLIAIEHVVIIQHTHTLHALATALEPSSVAAFEFGFLALDELRIAAPNVVCKIVLRKRIQVHGFLRRDDHIGHSA